MQMFTDKLYLTVATVASFKEYITENKLNHEKNAPHAHTVLHVPMVAYRGQ